MIDELDSGIYEYLLGECLEVMQDKAKGQLIFTSHNLRPYVQNHKQKYFRRIIACFGVLMEQQKCHV